LNPPDAAGGPGCSVGYVAAANGASQAASGLDHHLPVSIDLDNDPLSRLFAESDHDDDDDVEILISIQFISVSNECLTITINVFVMVGKFRHKENSQKLSHLVENVLTRISGYHFQAGNNFWG